jgi:formiminotetrahydrofolate cyclodeaminase
VAGFASLAVEDFCAALGSGEPTPGGGAAAALLAKLSASLVQMVARHTLGRPKYAHLEARMQAIVAQAEDLSAQAGGLMDADAEAFQAVAAAFKLARTDPGREQAVSAAAMRATEAPLLVMRAAARLAELGAELFRDGNQTLTGDARAALLLAQTAAEVSSGNVRANQPFIQDQAWAAAAADEAERLLAAISRLRVQLPE